jgi:hypothetical protein
MGSVSNLGLSARALCLLGHALYWIDDFRIEKMEKPKEIENALLTAE